MRRVVDARPNEAWARLREMLGSRTRGQQNAPTPGFRETAGAVPATTAAEAQVRLHAVLCANIAPPGAPPPVPRDFEPLPPRRPDGGPPLPLPEGLSFGAVLEMLDRQGAGRAAGAHGTSIPLLRRLPGQARYVLATLLQAVFEHGTLPAVWRDALLVGLPKPGKDPGLGAGWRGIVLLAAEVRLLFKCVCLAVTKTFGLWAHPWVAGFLPRSATRDSVLYTRILRERCVRAGLSLVVLYIDVAKGYDNLRFEDMPHVYSQMGIPEVWARALMLIAEQGRIVPTRSDRREFGAALMALQGAGIGLPSAPPAWSGYLSHVVLRALQALLERGVLRRAGRGQAAFLRGPEDRCRGAAALRVQRLHRNNSDQHSGHLTGAALSPRRCAKGVSPRFSS